MKLFILLALVTFVAYGQGKKPVADNTYVKKPAVPVKKTEPEDVVCKDNAGNAFTIHCEDDDGDYVNEQGIVEFMVKQTVDGKDTDKLPKTTYKGAHWHCKRVSDKQVACSSDAKKQKDGTYVYELYNKKSGEEVSGLEGNTKSNLPAGKVDAKKKHTVKPQ